MAEKTELLEEDEKVVEIELERLRGFENHPFKVRADSQMIELQESIKKHGILNPLMLRLITFIILSLSQSTQFDMLVFLR